MARVHALVTTLLLGSVGAVVPLAPSLSQPSGTLPADEGYAIDPPRQTVQNAPRGSVGRKTTDRQHRVGSTEETDGNERTIVLTVGGFVKECAGAVGITEGDFAVVEGDFVYSLTWDDTNSDEGEVRREHIERRMDARLEGHVLDDGEIDIVKLHGVVTIVHNGSHVQPRINTLPVDAEFKIDSNGFPAGLRGIGDASWAKPPDEGEHDVAATLIAGAAFFSSTNYELAHAAWMTPNKCVEAKFTPESESVSLSPGESKDVSTQIVTKEGQTPIRAIFRRADELPRSGVGTVAPERFAGEPEAEVTLRYTAPSRRERGSGFVVGAVSRAGAADGHWLISDAPNYELDLESRIISRAPEEAAQSTARATVRLTGSNKISRIYGDERRLYDGRGTISYTTVALPERDACDPAISGSGTTELTIIDAHIDVAAERDLNGTPTGGGRAEIELAYGIGLGGGETYNVPFVREFQCVLLPERAEPYFFWTSMYLVSRAEDGQINFLDKNGWTYVGQNGVVATKTLRGNCGGSCDEEVTKFTLREANPSQGR
jgi:hypothetical protein